MCVQLKNWPIDRLRRKRRVPPAHNSFSGRAAGPPSLTPSPGTPGIPTASALAEDGREVRGWGEGDFITGRSHGRLVTVPRKRPWTHKMWREGPRDAKPVFGGSKEKADAT